jgi:hypothetical protein
MGRIRNVRTGRQHLLAECSVIGRSPICDIRLSAPAVSAEHAAIRWAKPCWRIVDLGSRNGTWVSGRRLEVGVAAELDVGTSLCFASSKNPWLLESAEEPQAFVVGPEGELPIGQGLALPGPEDPQLQIWPTQDGSWLVEDAQGRLPAEDRDVFHVAGARWRLYLPASVPQTAAASRALVTMEDAELVVRHDRVEEHVTAELRPPVGKTIDLGNRAHNAVLLELARVRLEDRAQGVDPAEEGWIHREQLSARMGLEENHVNIMIFRLRRQLADLGVTDAANVVERRARSGMLRIGSPSVSVGRVG